MLKKLAYHPLAYQLNVDSDTAIAVHRQILQSKKLMRLVYEHWYQELMRGLEPTKHLEGLPMIELGAGASFLEEYIPGIIKTDCVANPNCAQVVNAEAMPFADNSVRLFFITAVMHHMHEPEKFLKEAYRCLAPGGRVVLIEPTDSIIGRTLTKWLHPYEFYDTKVKDWKNTGEGRMTNANCALPWVIFVRDRARYDASFPQLPIREIRYHTMLAYYITGGMTYRSLIPNPLANTFMACEKILWSLTPSLCNLMTIQLEKTNAL